MCNWVKTEVAEEDRRVVKILLAVGFQKVLLTIDGGEGLIRMFNKIRLKVVLLLIFGQFGSR